MRKDTPAALNKRAVVSAIFRNEPSASPGEPAMARRMSEVAASWSRARPNWACRSAVAGTAPSPLADFDGAFPALLRFIRALTSEFRPNHTTRLLHRGIPRLADGFRG